MSAQEGGALRCAGIQRFVDTYLDGEFAERDRAEFEEHLVTCESCRQKTKQQSDWRSSVRAAAPRELAPAALRNRVMRQIARQSPQRRSLRRWIQRVLPAAAAAGLLASYGASRLHLSRELRVCDDVIAKHQRNLPVEITGGTNQVEAWYTDKVDFPVRPPSFGQGVPLRGGRLADIGEHPAAYLVYDDEGNKVSVFEFDLAELPGSISSAHTAWVRGSEVRLFERRGYNLAVFQLHGVGYAIASAVDQEKLLRLVDIAISH
jgi:mycothiol system anti-sigma-R factor